MFRNLKIKIPVYIIAIIAAVITYFLSSQYNLGFSPDSVTYFETANSLIAGKGYTNLSGEYVNHWPPGYPTFIYIISKCLGISSILAGTIGNALIVFFTIITLFEIFIYYNIQVKISYLLLFLYIFSPVFSTYLWFLSEGLFILLILFSFLNFAKWINRDSITHLIICALALGASTLVRYAGIGFFMGYIAYFLLLGNFRSIKTISSKLFVFIFSFSLPVIPWLYYTNLNRVASHDRKFDYKLIPSAKLQEMYFSFASWVFGNLIGMLFLSFSILILVILYKKKLKFSIDRKFIPYAVEYFKLPLILGTIYILFILFSVSFLDHAIPLSNRIFSPIYPLFLLGTGSLLTYSNKKVSVKISYILPLLILMSYSFRSLPVYYNHYNQGSGFTSQNFQSSPLLNFVQKNLQNKILYTNDAFLLKIFTENQKIIQLPIKSNSSKLEEVRPQINNDEAAIIYLELINWRNYVVSKEKLLMEFKNYNTIQFKDGFILINN